MLSSINSSNKVKLAQSFYNFLSVVFDIAADPTFRDKELTIDGKPIYGTKLEDGAITRNYVVDLNDLSAVSSYIMDVADQAGYTFPTQEEA